MKNLIDNISSGNVFAAKKDIFHALYSKAETAVSELKNVIAPTLFGKEKNGK